MLNCAKEYGLLILGLLLFFLGSLILLPVFVGIFFWYVLLAIVHWDFSYIDEEQ